MKEASYSTGGQIGDLIKANGEDALVFAKKGEYILKDIQFSMLKESLDKAALLTKQNVLSSNPMSTIEKVEMAFNLYGVKDPKEFLHIVQTDKSVQNAITSLLLDKNSLSKNRFK